jgi:hypothetical protein
MKILLSTIFCAVALIISVTAVEDVNIGLITTPLYHKMEDADVRFVKIPHVAWDIDAEQHCYFYSKPYMAGHSNIEQDINLISLYGIKVIYTHKDGVDLIDIVTKNAKRPDSFKYSVIDVANLTAKAVRMDLPDERSFVVTIDGSTIKLGEQDGTVQPATRPESKSEGSDKPQPESEGRSR